MSSYNNSCWSKSTAFRLNSTVQDLLMQMMGVTSVGSKAQRLMESFLSICHDIRTSKMLVLLSQNEWEGKRAIELSTSM